MKLSIHRWIHAFAIVGLVMAALAGLLSSASAQEPAPLTYELCDALDENNNGIIEGWEEDGLRWDLPDLDGDGEAIGSQADQDVAVAGCPAILADAQPEPAPPSLEALIQAIIQIILAILAGL